ncbi:hypothetical protein ACSNOH_32525 [Streptomyces sp. URMC 127]|uniref:hypothetical protein n=1 Tax=Streptomyces sp. URMC 127 TaxID=3423402 RepID=UPI003F1C92D3
MRRRAAREGKHDSHEWARHWNWQHIEANSGPLFVFGFLAAYRGVARFLGLSVLVMAGCGLTAWVFGDHGIAYVVLRGLFDRHLIDSLIGVVMAGSYACLLTAAVPGAPGSRLGT